MLKIQKIGATPQSVVSAEDHHVQKAGKSLAHTQRILEVAQKCLEKYKGAEMESSTNNAPMVALFSSPLLSFSSTLLHLEDMCVSW